MKFTKDNLLTEYPKYEDRFPKPLRDAYPTIAENLDLYGNDAQIDAIIDKFLDKCNEVLNEGGSGTKENAKTEKQKPKARTTTKKEASAKNAEGEKADTATFNMTVMAKYRNEKFKAMDVTAGVQVRNLLFASLIKSDKLDELITLLEERVTDDWQFKVVKAGTSTILWQSDKPSKQKETENPTESKSTGTKAPKGKAKDKSVPGRNKKSEKADVPTVEQMPAEIALLKSFYNMHGVVKTKTQVYNLIKKLQKAIADKAIRKTSPHAAQIEYMQRHLIAIYNTMKSGQKKYEISEEKLAELKKIIDIKLADHVVIIRAFINILNETKTGLMEKAMALDKKINNSKFPDTAKSSIEAIKKSLSHYISGATDTVHINKFDLQGLYGLAGLNGINGLGNELPAASQNIPIPASELIKMKFKTLKLSGRWEQLIGEPTDPFYIMIWGDKGKGKSTLAIEFAKYLNATFRKRILYVASEEGVSGVLQSKFIRLNAGIQNIHVANALPPNLVEYDCIFIDSVNTMNIKVEEIEAIKKMYPFLSIVLMFQSRRDGEFKGNNSFPHLVDAVIECNDGKASCPEKNRYGGKGTIDIVFEEQPKTDRTLKGWIM